MLLLVRIRHWRYILSFKPSIVARYRHADNRLSTRLIFWVLLGFLTEAKGFAEALPDIIAFLVNGTSEA
jgi:hypothetical protein